MPRTSNERGTRTRDAGRHGSNAAQGADAEIAAFVSRAHERSVAYERLPAISAWQRRMEQYPQLSASSQNELVAQFQEGRAASERLDAGGRRSGAAERKLRAVVRRGDYAAEMLAGSNFRLLLLIAREKAEERYGKDRAAKVLPDLIAEANLALVQAAAEFDASKGPSFPTYLAKVVRDRMLAVLAKEHAIKLPPSWVRVRRIHSVRLPKLTEELGRTPSLEEMQTDLMRVCMEWAEQKLSPAELQLPAADREEACLDRLRKQGMLGAIAKLADVLSVTAQMGSTDAPLSDDGGSVGDLLQSTDADPNTGVEAEELRRLVAEALQALPDRERQIVLYRYGFVDGDCWTYQRISKEFGVSPERIRQIEKAVIVKMGLPHEGFGSLAAFANPS